MPRRPFREVWHLWLAPDFSRVERGESEPPWVDQTKLDFQGLRKLLLDAFGNGTVNVRVPNDTIDQVTCHFRDEGVFGTGDQTKRLRCEDFAKKLRLEARKQAGDVVDMRRLWTTLHHLQNREIVPPPVILPLLLESEDFEDMMFARMAARQRLGMTDGHPLEAMLNSDDPLAASMEQEPKQGMLPDAFRARLEAILGAEYLPQATIDFVSHDPLPKWTQQQAG